MNSRVIVTPSRKNKKITMDVIAGHFATNHSHINYFLDMTQLKSMHKMAKLVAKEFASKFVNDPIEAIICTERTKMIGAFLADELSASGINQNVDIAVITPEFNSFNQMLLRDNVQSLIWNKHVLLLAASITTGITANSMIDAINYYGGLPAGIATIFSTEKQIGNVKLECIFDKDDIPGYETNATSNCPLCKKKIKLDALVNSYGYSKL